MVSQDPLSGRPPLVTLLTDFGLTDAYVGVMKGVILSLLPTATLVDLTHELQPQAIVPAAFLLESAWRFFPPGTVHLAVVDPGVGTSRRRIALRSQGQLFVGPDNGLLSPALPDETRGYRGAGHSYEPREVALPPDIEAVSIENPALFRDAISATFEGRDVFAPAAAHLAGGDSLDDLGPRLSSLLALPSFRAPTLEGRIDGVIVHVDHFGNLISDVRAADLPALAAISIAGRTLSLSMTYGDADGLCAIIGSSGFVEIAMPNGSAADLLGIGRSERLSVTSAVA